MRRGNSSSDRKVTDLLPPPGSLADKATRGLAPIVSPAPARERLPEQTYSDRVQEFVDRHLLTERGLVEARPALGRLLALEHDIRSATGRRASAIVLPADVAPGLTAFSHLPVLRGDRVALLFEPTP